MPTRTFVCRCEDVTLRDLREAVAKGHRDLESVKRYTGFGTGWCQGRHCMALCGQLLGEMGGEVPVAPFTARPPFHPVPLALLARLLDAEDPIPSDGP